MSCPHSYTHADPCILRLLFCCNQERKNALFFAIQVISYFVMFSNEQSVTFKISPHFPLSFTASSQIGVRLLAAGN